MSTFDWQEQLAKRRRRTKYERIATLSLIVFVLGFFLWRIFYANTPEYALDRLSHALAAHDSQSLQKYCSLEDVTSHAYDDLTRDMFASDDKLSNDTKVMFEQFYIKIKPQILDNTQPLLLSYVETGSWQPPGSDNILKGRQLGIDYEYLIERSQLRSTAFVKIESIDRTGDTALAKVQVRDEYTGTLFTLNLLLTQAGDNWQVTRIVNYRDFLDFLRPIQSSGLTAYIKATKSIIDKYNDIMDTQQTNFGRLSTTDKGSLTADQRSKLAGYIKSDIIPALEKRQQELNAVPVNDGAQYLQKLRAQETQLSLAEWQHFLKGIQENSFPELNIAKAFHANALELQHRIDDVIKNTAVNKMAKSIP